MAELRLTVNKPILGTLPGLGLKLAPKTSQEAILKHFQSRSQKCGFRKLLGYNFEAFPGSGPKVTPEDYKQTGRQTRSQGTLSIVIGGLCYGCH